MKSFLILLSLCCFWVVSVVSANKDVSPLGRVEIALNENFDIPDGLGNGHRSMPSPVPFSAFLNDNHSIDLEFYQPVGEVEIIISQNGKVVYSFTEDVVSPVLRNVQLQQDLSGSFLLEVKGDNNAYAYGWFSLF